MSSFVAIQLFGPEFTGPATAISQKVGVGTISTLQVCPGTGAVLVHTLAPALGILKNYFARNAGSVVLYLNPALITQSLMQQLQNSCGVPVSLASPMLGSLASFQASDFQDAQTIGTQMSADNQKQQMQRWKILQDTQTKIFEIQQDVTVNKARTQDKAFQSWDQYIRD